MTKNILICAGEASGDIHAANLVKSLKKLNPNLSFSGIGGKRMEDAGVALIERMDRFSVVGVWEAFVKLREIRRIYKKITKEVKAKQPACAILVDYPGFNLTLARALKKRGVKVVYYITPQVWAWGGFRIHLIKRYVDKTLVILKFEEDLFKRHGIDTVFVGHPLMDGKFSGATVDKKSLNLDGGKLTIALLPGSRDSEVKKVLPIMLRTAEHLLRKKEIQFILLKSSSAHKTVYDNILKRSRLAIAEIEDDTCRCLTLSDFIFTSSGTATLECAIMGRPMLITYRTSFLTFLLFRIFTRIPFIGLVNIIAKKEIAPEILQYNARPDRLAAEILSIISSKEKLEGQLQGLRQVKSMLGPPGASGRAARIVAGFIQQQ